MCPLVVCELEALAKVPVTLGAGKGLLNHVHKQVLLEHGLLAKGLAALRAGKGPFTSVDAPVLGEIGVLAEALAALGAGKGSFASVDLPELQHRSAPEVLAAFHVAEGLVARVHCLILEQHCTSCEALAAFTAWEGTWGLGHTRKGRRCGTRAGIC